VQGKIMHDPEVQKWQRMQLKIYVTPAFFFLAVCNGTQYRHIFSEKQKYYVTPN
jgi:hypothetical protein